MARGEFTMHRCAMAGVEAVAAQTRHVFPRHTHAQFGIGVVHRGAQKSYSGRGMVEAGPGDTITVNPGEVHDGTPLGEAGRAWTMLYFTPSLIQEAAADLGVARPLACEFTRPALSDAATAGRFHRLFAAMTGLDGEAAAMHCEELLLALLDGLLHERRGDEDRACVSIGPARRLIDEEPTAPLLLADLARESGLSRFQVLRGFVRATGFTPHAYLLQRRVDLARRLIAGRTPLVEAALASGFADQSHMTRVFVHRYGVSPGAYAQALA